MKRLIGIVVLLGCSACAVPKTQTRTEDQEQFAALTSVIEAQRRPKSNQAMVTVAIFGGAELSDSKALNIAIGPFLNDELGRSIRGRTGQARPHVVSAKADEKLPLDMETLAQGAGDQGAHIRRASHVAFVRYAGPPLSEHKQIRTTLGAAAIIASSPNHILIDLSTRRAMDAITFAAWVKGDSTLRDQIVPGVERTPKGVTFYTRGFTKFGLPDLEMSHVAPADARARFSRFQETVSTLRNGAYVKVGDTLNGMTLMTCRRAPEAFESECVRLP